MDQGDSSGLSRRRLLQATVAGGVGAAAWSAPNIKTLGFKPAYAQICSTASDVMTFTSTPGRVSCGTAAFGLVVRLNDVVTFGPGDEHTLWVSGDTMAHGGNHFEMVSTGLLCRIVSIELWDLDGAYHDSWLVDQVPGLQPAPEIGQAGGLGVAGSRCQVNGEFYEWTATIEAVPDGGCFPPPDQD